MNHQISKAGPYDLIDVVHRGPRAVIYLATRGDAEQQVVVKMATDATALDSALPTAASRLVHRHIVRVIDSGVENGFPFVVMERLQGRTLAELMSDSTFAADVPTRVDLIAQLCIGLHHAHEQQLVHGNLRPEHVFVTDDGVTKILNFGATPAANDRTIVSDNALAGSFEYMSPEQIIGRDAIDGRSDVFSAGVMLYEFVSGQRPFQGGSTPATLARILRDDPLPLEGLDRLNTILRRALEKEPAKRFASAQEFAYALWMMDLPVAPIEDEADQAQAAGSETIYADAARDSAPDDDGDGDEEAAVGSRFPVSPQTLLYATIALVVVIVSAIAVVSC